MIQAGFLTLHDDEAYYWLFSKYPAFGYFDHPPMMAWLMSPFSALGQNSLLVRLATAVLSSGAFILLSRLIRELRGIKVSPSLLFLLFFSLPLLNLYGFIAGPDAPLIFFSSLFLFALIRFAKKARWKHTILLGICMVLLMYSKYHGALFILLSLAALFPKLKPQKLVVAIALALFLYLPHFIWLYEHQFVSIEYHLFERQRSDEWYQPLIYLGGQILIFAPAALIFRQELKEMFKQVGKRISGFIAFGFILFFLLMSFKGSIEAHWTAAGMYVFAVLIYPQSEKHLRRKKGALIFLCVLLFILRLGMLTGIPKTLRAFQKGGEWASEIEGKAAHKPVIFMNSYSDAAKYTFYTGKTAWSDNNHIHRKNQFNLWERDTALHKQEVFYISDYVYDNFESLGLNDKHFRVFESYQPIQRMKGDMVIDSLASNLIWAEARIYNPYPYTIELNHSELPLNFKISFIRGDSIWHEHTLESPGNKIHSGDQLTIPFSIELPEEVEKALEFELRLVTKPLSERVIARYPQFWFKDESAN